MLVKLIDELGGGDGGMVGTRKSALSIFLMKAWTLSKGVSVSSAGMPGMGFPWEPVGPVLEVEDEFWGIVLVIV